ncbi:hypothetical protein [Enterococcus sp. 5H]|uniref:hypothetical protein n=1 Tax=Enterococcus sp. 5H TaxID=1229490 RepID=UPI0023021EA9|nr:hypothetical protein [Enterococcus sp. 5H]MDA9471988.1 hypothetical protein [Enterococcus sp. 5H]
MEKIFYFLMISLFCLSGCKIEYNSPQSARDDNYGVNSPGSYSSEDSGDDKTSGTTLTKKGTGDEVITNLAFKKGPTLFSIVYEGQAEITVKLLDSDGNIVATLVDFRGKYSGKVLAQVPKDADNYILEIKTEGNWQVESAKEDEKSGDN